MKKQYFETKRDGFYGVYWKNEIPSSYGVIAMLGDDPEDYLAASCAKWLLKLGLNVLTLSPGKKDYSYHNYPLERIEAALAFLKKNGNSKLSIIGASTTGTLALASSSIFQDISLTIALSPSDFVWQGFEQGNRDGCKEWPIEGESLFSYQGKPLPYMPFCYPHPLYWEKIKEESKETNNMIASRKIFDDSEAKHPLREEEFIKVENIRGKLLLIGAEDDSLWDTARYIRRIEKRLQEKEHFSDLEILLYEHGTHFVFPESLYKKVFPIASKFLLGLLFRAAKDFPNECQATRKDIDRGVRKAISDWKNQK